MASANREGVIKFQLDFQQDAPPDQQLLGELNAWREIFRRLGLLGQDPERYDGFGFGNLSRRLPDRDDAAFLISGTQTGHLQQLRRHDYATVHECDPAANQLRAAGRIQPSSEALSHAVLYQSRPEVDWVMHLHSPEIFAHSKRLGLPCTEPGTAYGTPEMAADILHLVRAHDLPSPGLLIMGGHPDGILAFGSTAAATGRLVVETLALALQYSHRTSTA